MLFKNARNVNVSFATRFSRAAASKKKQTWKVKGQVQNPDACGTRLNSNCKFQTYNLSARTNNTALATSNEPCQPKTILPAFVSIPAAPPAQLTKTNTAPRYHNQAIVTTGFETVSIVSTRRWHTTGIGRRLPIMIS